MVGGMIRIIFATGMFCLLLIVGCNQQDESTNKEILMLRDKIDDLNNKMESLEYRFKAYDFLILGDVYFSSDSKGFLIAKTSLGDFPIFLKEFPKKSNGYKAILMIGNPYSLVIENFEIEASWPIVQVNNISETLDYSKIKSKTYSINNKLFPAIWNEVTIHVPPVDYDNIDYVRIKFSPLNINFEGDYRKTLEKLKAIELIHSITK